MYFGIITYPVYNSFPATLAHSPHPVNENRQGAPAFLSSLWCLTGGQTGTGRPLENVQQTEFSGRAALWKPPRSFPLWATPSHVVGMFSPVCKTVSSSLFRGVAVLLVFVFNVSDNYLLFESSFSILRILFILSVMRQPSQCLRSLVRLNGATLDTNCD